MKGISDSIALIATATLLTACGGSSGGSDSSPPQDAVGRSTSFLANISGEYNSRNLTIIPDLSDYTPTEKITERTVTYSDSEVEILRERADEIGSDHYCDVRTSGETFCSYMSDDNSVRVTKSVNRLTSEAYQGIQMHHRNGSLTEFTIIISGDVSGVNLSSMVPSPTGKIDEFETAFSIAGDWQVKTANYSVDDPAPLINESEISCSDSGCSGSYNFDDVFYMRKSGERYAWTASGRTDRGEEATIVGTISKDGKLMSFFSRTGSTYYVSSAVAK